MKKVLAVSVPLLLIAAVAAFLFFRKEPVAVSPKITIQFTCDTAGRLEPCGCFTGQHGGLTRLRTFIEAGTHKGDVVRLDVGGAIAGKEDYHIIQYKYLAQAYETMGFTALNMGGREAMLSPETLTQLASSSPVPLISASLVDAVSREEILTPYRIVEAGGKRIGIIGVVSPLSVPTPGEGVTVLALNEAIDRQLAEISGKTDLNILLAFATAGELEQLAHDYYEFALILGGDVAGPTQEIIRKNDSIILYTTNQARTVGTLKATLAGEKRTRLTETSYEIDLLWDTIPQNEELHAMVEEYRSEIRNTPLAIDDPGSHDPDAIPGVTGSATYVGSASCKQCHGDAHAVWGKSGHAHAFETLVKAGADADPNCIACHTVGFGKESGYRRPFAAEKLTDVGCESCHGPASEHLDRHLHGKNVSFKFRPLGSGDCQSCHHGEFSRPFDWEKFWPGISHK